MAYRIRKYYYLKVLKTTEPFDTLRKCNKGHSIFYYPKQAKPRCPTCDKVQVYRLRAENVEHFREYSRQWRRRNPHKVYTTKEKSRHKTTMRRAQKLKATPWWADVEAIKQVYISCPKGMEVDHRVPLISKVVCGLHVSCNLHYLDPSENRKKSNQLLDRYVYDKIEGQEL